MLTMRMRSTQKSHRFRPIRDESVGLLSADNISLASTPEYGQHQLMAHCQADFPPMQHDHSPGVRSDRAGYRRKGRLRGLSDGGPRGPYRGRRIVKAT